MRTNTETGCSVLTVTENNFKMEEKFEIKSVDYNEETNTVEIEAVKISGIKSVTTEITITKEQDKYGEKKIER